MADALKVLGQSNPAATTLTTLYIVPAATSTVASTLTVCNQSSSAGAAFRVSVQIAAAADNAKQYLYYDLPIMPSDTFHATIGLSLATTDVVKVYASSSNLSFNLTGVEVT